MRVQESLGSASNLMAVAALAAVVFTLLPITGNGLSAAPSAAVKPDTVRIEVTLQEFAFVPDTIRVPAGQPVTLVITNAGQVPHEFMAGREVHEGSFEHDLFADLHVNMMTGAMADEGGGHGHMGEGHAGAEEEGEQGDDSHGTMVMPQPGETVSMSFTLPESRHGVWSIGCFLPGHYEAGMHATLIVE